jgi:hypothetical protein
MWLNFQPQVVFESLFGAFIYILGKGITYLLVLKESKWDK